MGEGISEEVFEKEKGETMTTFESDPQAKLEFDLYALDQAVNDLIAHGTQPAGMEILRRNTEFRELTDIKIKLDKFFNLISERQRAAA